MMSAAIYFQPRLAIFEFIDQWVPLVQNPDGPAQRCCPIIPRPLTGPDLRSGGPEGNVRVYRHGAQISDIVASWLLNN